MNLILFIVSKTG